MKQSGLGIVSLILGIIGILISCIIIGAIPCIIGLIVGVTGLFQRDRKHTLCIAGISTSVAGMLLTIVMAAVLILSADMEDTTTSHIVSKPEDHIVMNMPGDTVEMDGLQIQYISAEEYIGDDVWEKPSEGNVIYKVTFEFTNVSDKTVYVYTTDFSCYADNYIVDASYISSEHSNFSTKLSPGKKTKGELFYEAPAGAMDVELEYNTLLMGIEDTIYFRVK